MKWLPCIITAVLVGGCAFGQRYNYADVAVTVPVKAASASSSIALAVHDRRAYVVSGGKQPTFVGISRGGYGNPFDVHTQSGAPLAADMAGALEKSLIARGYKVSQVPVQPSETTNGAKRLLIEKGANRLVLLTLTEWRSDTMMRSDLHFDVSLAVYDERGEQLATKSAKGMDALGSVGRAGVSASFARKIQELFDDDKVIAALKM